LVMHVVDKAADKWSILGEYMQGVLPADGTPP
jgi:hypothetical protein